MSLRDKVIKDLSRLIVFSSQMIYLCYNVVASHLNMLSFVGMMGIGRIAGLFHAHPGRALHRMIGTVHQWAQRLGAFFYPDRILESVAVAHPTHTIQRIGDGLKQSFLPKEPGQFPPLFLTPIDLGLSPGQKRKDGSLDASVNSSTKTDISSRSSP